MDALRGAALFGLFFVHMVESYELFWADPHYEFATNLVFLFFSGKCFAVLALCFGFSFYMLVDRHGSPNAATSVCYLRRLAILGAFGFIHSLLYRGDILVLLAILGAPLLLASRVQSNKVLLAIAGVLVLQPLILFELLVAPESGASAGGYPDISMSMYQHGSLAEVLRTNLWEGQKPKWTFMLESGRLFQAAGLTLYGIVLGRIGFFKRLPTSGRVQLVRLFGALLAAGLLHHWQRPLVVLACSSGTTCETALGTIVQGWAQLATTLVWVLVVCTVWVRFSGKALRSISLVGRATLSFYVLQSLVFVPLFYNFGAGFAEIWSTTDRLICAVAGALLQLWIATSWFKHFAYGPLEWIWRVLTLSSWDVPFRRAAPTNASLARAGRKPPELGTSEHALPSSVSSYPAPPD